MSLLSRLFSRRPDGREAVRPLWRRIVEIAREREWYAQCGVADTVPGRFDAVTLVLALVLLRMERDPALIEPAARLTELFVEDMDGQLRQNGIGDIVVGKHIGRLMSVLGGRLGALREALAQDSQAHDGAAMTGAVARNVSLIEGSDPVRAARRARELADRLAALAGDDIMAARI